MEDTDGGEVPEQLFEASKELHACYHHAICDNCDYPILGIRWKCSNCADFDMCAGCMLKHSEDFSLHDPRHFFLKIERPLTEREAWLKQFPKEIIASHQDVDLNCMVHRGVFCSLCKMPIIGVRYVCTNCVSLFQLCEGCDSRKVPTAGSTSGPSTTSKYRDNHFNGRSHIFLRVPFAVSHQVVTRLAPNKRGEQVELNARDKDVHLEPEQFSYDSSSSEGDQMQMNLSNSLFESPPVFSPENAQVDTSGERIIFNANPDDPPFPLYSVAYPPTDPPPAIVSKPVRKAQYALSRSLSENREMSVVCIREMEFEDLPNVLEIEYESFSSPYDQKFFERMLRKGHYSLWVCLVEDTKKRKILGIGGYICFRLSSKRWLDVVSVAVSSRCRGCGIGSSLMGMISNLAEAYAIENCQLHVSIYNEPALRLYKKLGFIPTVWVTRYYADENEDAIVMHKDLTT